MRYIFIIEGELTDLNTYIKALNSNRYSGNELKQINTFDAKVACNDLPPITEFPVYITMIWRCKNKRKDPDNIAFAKKFILDGMVQAKVIPDDSFKYIAGFKDVFHVSDEPCIEVNIETKS